MSFWGKIFGTDKAIQSGIEAVKSGLDMLVYTDEEKAIDNAKAVTEARSMVVDWMNATQGQNLARRLIALVVTGIWAVQFIGAMLLGVITAFTNDPDMVGKLIAASAVINSSAQQMNGAVMLILGFYFAAPHMEGIAKAAMQKFGSQK